MVTSSLGSLRVGRSRRRLCDLARLVACVGRSSIIVGSNFFSGLFVVFHVILVVGVFVGVFLGIFLVFFVVLVVAWMALFLLLVFFVG